jgi:CTP synthase
MHSINNNTKYVIVTGGVLSGLGKGVVSASIGKLLSTGKNKIVTIKCDGYLNVDPGTMNPIEHGEVFVLDDGGEVDLDFGHYERFLGINCKFDWNLTSGKIFKLVIDKERKGDYLGKTVQMIPHVTNEIKKKFKEIARKEKADIVMIEMGGTAGDIEMMLFNEAARQMRLDVVRDNMCFVHVTYVPEPSAVGEQKTKPTQQSVEILRRAGINPEIIIGRSPRPLDKRTKQKIALFANLLPEEVISDPDFEQVYELPIIFEKEGLPDLLRQKLGISKTHDLKNWKKIVENIKKPKDNVTIAICGKYTELHDSYISIMEALKHVCGHSKIKSTLKWIETTEIEEGNMTPEECLEGIDGVIIPGGFGSRGTEGKIQVMQYVREHGIPFLGICLGMQIAVIEFARNVCGLKGANSTEFDEKCTHPVIDLLPEQREVTEKGGTMRLGGHDIRIKKDSFANKMFKSDKIRRRFRHRFEVNPEYVDQLVKHGIVFSGYTPDKKIMQITELPGHPYFIAGQFHPELTSSVESPDEMFFGLVKAAAKRKF